MTVVARVGRGPRGRRGAGLTMITSMLSRDVAEPSPDWEDPDLVEACLRGSEAAWVAIIDKYARLIWSVPFKFRFTRTDAEDVFQAVCTDLVAELHTLREPAALRGWLLRVTTHKCLHARRRGGREEATDAAVIAAEQASPGPSPEELVAELQQHQLVREAMAQLSGQCRELLRLLFVEAPARPYDEVARQLGVTRGSVSFLRGRCLQRLHRAMQALGFGPSPAEAHATDR